MSFDLVKETSDTEGTGSYSLLGAAADFLPFSSVLPGDGAGIPYVARMGSTYEAGIGTLSGSGTTLARTVVLGGTNGTSPVNWTAGEKELYVARSGHLQPPIRHNQAIGAYPTTAENAEDGYDVLSLAQAGGIVFICTQSSDVSATWRRLLLLDPTGNGDVAVNSNGRFALGSGCDVPENYSGTFGENCTAFAPYTFMSGSAARNPWANAAVVGGGEANLSVALGARIPLAHETNDATPSVIGSLNGDTPELQAEGAMYIRAMVTAKEESAADAKCWFVEALLMKNSTTLSVVGTATVTEKFATAGAASWSLAFGVSGSTIQFTATGEAATDIEWSVVVDAGAVFDGGWGPP